MEPESVNEHTVGGEHTTRSVNRDAPRELRVNAQRVMLAGMGAVASACDVAGDRFERFVRRGERVREELQDRSDDVLHETEGRRVRARDYFRHSMDSVLDSLQVPNKTDVDTINVKLNILTRKIDDLHIQQMGSGTTTKPPVAVPDQTPPPVSAAGDPAP